MEMFADAGYPDVEHSANTLNEDELIQKIKGAHIPRHPFKNKSTANV